MESIDQHLQIMYIDRTASCSMTASDLELSREAAGSREDPSSQRRKVYSQA